MARLIFRSERGRLAEAVKESHVFGSFQEMAEWLSDTWDGAFSPDDVVVDGPETDDERIGWHDTRYVCTKRMGDIDYMEVYGCPQAIGYCAADWDMYQQTHNDYQDGYSNIIIHPDGRIGKIGNENS